MPTRLHTLLAAMIARLMRLFGSRGVVVAEPDRIWIEEARARADGPSALAQLNQASTTYRTLNAWSNHPCLAPIAWRGGKGLPDLGAAGLRGVRRA